MSRYNTDLKHRSLGGRWARHRARVAPVGHHQGRVDSPQRHGSRASARKKPRRQRKDEKKEEKVIKLVGFPEPTGGTEGSTRGVPGARGTAGYWHLAGRS